MSSKVTGRHAGSDPQAEPHWHVLGAGALGTVIAHRLSRVGVPCTLLSHRRGSSQELRIGDARHAVCVTALDRLEGDGISRLLLTTKAGQIEAAMQLALPRLTADAVVLTTANGLGFPERFTLHGRDVPLQRAVSTAAAFRDASGTVTLAAVGETRVGGRAAAANWFRDSIARLDDWHWDPAIDKAITTKFALNCVINPLTATRRCRNGRLLDDAAAAAELADLCRETQPALEALGMWTDGEALLARAQRVCRDTAANRSSMLQDVLAGRETEIDYLTGELLRRAQRRKLALPRNTALYAAVRALHP